MRTGYTALWYLVQGSYRSGQLASTNIEFDHAVRYSACGGVSGPTGRITVVGRDDVGSLVRRSQTHADFHKERPRHGSCLCWSSNARCLILEKHVLASARRARDVDGIWKRGTDDVAAEKKHTKNSALHLAMGLSVIRSIQDQSLVTAMK
jgi:hypothetical protein